MSTAAAEKRARRLQRTGEYEPATIGSLARRSARGKEAPEPERSEAAAQAEHVASAGGKASSNKKGRARPAAAAAEEEEEEESRGRKKKKSSAEPEEGSESTVAVSLDGEEGFEDEIEGNGMEEQGEVGGGGQQQKRKAYAVKRDSADNDQECSFVGDPVPEAEARERWSKRYPKKAFS